MVPIQFRTGKNESFELAVRGLRGVGNPCCKSRIVFFSWRRSPIVFVLLCAKLYQVVDFILNGFFFQLTSCSSIFETLLL